MSASSKKWLARAACAGAVALGGMLYAQSHEGPPQPWSKWKVHDMSRPKPPIIEPGTASTQEQPGKPPSDAIVLFDGKDLSHFKSASKGGDPQWKVQDGYMEGAGDSIVTKEGFGDAQYHAEWSEPVPGVGESQGRGNSGFIIQSRYEIQVLDSYKNETYADGQCAAIYGQYPPLVNCSRPPGQWQTYDIIFHRPRFGPDGKVTHPAHVTVIQNGVLMQDNQMIHGPTGHMIVGKYSPNDNVEKAPLELQFHGNAVRFRNVWVRPLADHHDEGQEGAAEHAAEASKPGEQNK